MALLPSRVGDVAKKAGEVLSGEAECGRVVGLAFHVISRASAIVELWLAAARRLQEIIARASPKSNIVGSMLVLA